MPMIEMRRDVKTTLRTSPEMVASSAIFAALTDMIDTYGENTVADMVAEWPDRIRDGEFTLKDGD